MYARLNSLAHEAPSCRLLTYFYHKQTLVLRNEDLRSNPEEVLKQIYQFLSVGVPAGDQAARGTHLKHIRIGRRL